MIYYDNGKLQIFANTRCGNTNMHHYFNLDVSSYQTFPTAFSNELIIVLRNPLDRMVSAVNGLTLARGTILFPISILKKVLSKEYTWEFLIELGIFDIHCKPYLSLIENNSFRIIDFNKLSEYIPRRSGFSQSPVTNSKGHTDPGSVYVENRYFSLSDLEKEYDVYCNLLRNREQISVAEWKEKTT